MAGRFRWQREEKYSGFSVLDYQSGRFFGINAPLWRGRTKPAADLINYLTDDNMSKVCQVTGKRTIRGNNVSHANNRTRRSFVPNLHSHRFWLEGEQRWVKLRVSHAGLRTIDKKGIDVVLQELRDRGEKV